MTKRLFVTVLAVLISASAASAQSILQRSDWQQRGLETYLPPPAPTVPWLDLNTKTRLPKGDLPLGRNTASTDPFVLPSAHPDTQISSNASTTFRSM